jgi:hypothetical protein
VTDLNIPVALQTWGKARTEPVDRDAVGCLLATCDDMRKVLAALNAFGDRVDSTIANQGGVYGKVHDALVQLVGILYPDDGVEGRAHLIVNVMYDDVDVRDAAKQVADEQSPMWGISTDDVRTDLVKYRAWLRALDDQVLDVSRVVQSGDPAEAAAWLTDQIAECVAALEYRDEPEIARIIHVDRED